MLNKFRHSAIGQLASMKLSAFAFLKLEQIGPVLCGKSFYSIAFFAIRIVFGRNKTFRFGVTNVDPASFRDIELPKFTFIKCHILKLNFKDSHALISHRKADIGQNHWQNDVNPINYIMYLFMRQFRFRPKCNFAFFCE